MGEVIPLRSGQQLLAAKKIQDALPALSLDIFQALDVVAIATDAVNASLDRAAPAAPGGEEPASGISAGSFLHPCFGGDNE